MNDGTQVVQRVFALIRAISTRPHSGWRLSELASYCELNHSTTHRLLNGLVREGMVMQDSSTRRYRLGRLVFELGLAVRDEFDWQTLCTPILKRVAEATGDTAFFNLRSGHESICIARCEGAYPLKALTVEVGGRRPLCVSAGGAAMLAHMAEEEVEKVMQASAPYLKRFGPDRIHAIERLLQESRELGYGYNSELIIPSVCAIGVAICNQAGEPIAAISVATIKSRLSGSRRQEVLNVLRRETRLGDTIEVR